ncbi:MAG: hypothetical protein MJE68_29555, partial [Proteobacteria bacterium]|nr:hypothetical protein [Pseudomonadota bacterium]
NKDRERDRACVSITSSLVPGCHAPELIAATKFKTTKINFGGLFGLSTKITRYTVLVTVLPRGQFMSSWGMVCLFNVGLFSTASLFIH